MKSRCIFLILIFLVPLFPNSAAGPDPLTLARDEYSTGEYEQAIRWYDEILATDPTNETAIVGRLKTLAALSRWEEVFNEISGSGLDTRDNTTVKQLLAEGYAKTGRPEQSLSLLDNSSGISSADELYIRTEALIALKRDEEALALLKMGEGKGFGDPRLSLLMGTLLLGQKNSTAAIPYLEEAYIGLPRDPDAAAELGSAIASHGLYEEALVFADTAIDLDPDNPDNLATKAYLLNRLERYDEALDVLDQAIMLVPGDPDQMNAKAYTLYLAGRPGEAKNIVEEALKKKPGDPAALDTMGCILLTEGDPGEALRYLKQAADSLSGDPEILTHLGDALRLLDRNSEAQDLYQKAVLIDPTSGRTWRGYSEILLDLKRYPEAVEAIAQAYRHYPKDPELIAWEQKADKVLLDWYQKGQGKQAR